MSLSRDEANNVITFFPDDFVSEVVGHEDDATILVFGPNGKKAAISLVVEASAVDVTTYWDINVQSTSNEELSAVRWEEMSEDTVRDICDLIGATYHGDD